MIVTIMKQTMFIYGQRKFPKALHSKWIISQSDAPIAQEKTYTEFGPNVPKRYIVQKKASQDIKSQFIPPKRFSYRWFMGIGCEKLQIPFYKGTHLIMNSSPHY